MAWRGPHPGRRRLLRDVHGHRPAAHRRETGPIVIAQQAYALALALGLAALVGLAGGRVIPSTVTPVGLASAIASGVLYYAAAYWFYLSALRRVPAPLAAMSFYLIPIVGVAGGTALLGERLAASQLIGGAIVVAALLIAAAMPAARTIDAVARADA
jgi:drug/metabolite transporter (DMT)-like permease